MNKRGAKPKPKPPTEPDSVRIVGSSGASQEVPTPKTTPEIVGVLPLRDSVLFPNLAIPVIVGRERSLKLLEHASQTDRLLAAVTVTPPPDGIHEEEPPDPPPPDRMHGIGTLARIAELMRLPNGASQVALQGIDRIRIVEWLQPDPYLRARVEVLDDTGEGEESETLMRTVLGTFRRVADLAPYIPPPFVVAAINIREPSDLANFLASNLNTDTETKQQLLSTSDVPTRLKHIDEILNQELELLELSHRTHEELSEDVAKAQREQFLRRQLEVIQRELGESDPEMADVIEIRRRLETIEMPDATRTAAEREASRLERIPSASPEYGIIRTYLDWLCDIPWSIRSQDKTDIANARKVLDDDHYGLQDVKERVLEYLAVASLRKDNRSPILCFVGPPGVGKTSLGKSIARALGRQFVRMSLGGVHDEAEIRGHRRTYIGALPGRIVQGVKRAGTINPVMMLDEVDKLGADFRGDPSAALLEVLDPAQNDSFSDHYLEVPLDLSEVLFICTANLRELVPGPLLDRLEVIDLRGYTEVEKVEIAKHHLIPRQIEEHGLSSKQVMISAEGIRKLIRDYTSESGVRNLERQIASTLRKVAIRIASKKSKGKIVVDGAAVASMLGVPKIFKERIGSRDEIGVSTGLAWTPYGGEILSIEAVAVPGKGTFTLTGHLGEVMQESARAAFTYVKSRAKELGADQKWFEDRELHVHVPAGAVPKDGPSAGIAIATAMSSAVCGTAVRRTVAMTGEITLRGNVLPIGGVKEKVIAAHRAGATTVILPTGNGPFLDEVPLSVRRGLKFVLADHMDDVLRKALVSNGTAVKKSLEKVPKDTGSARVTGRRQPKPTAASRKKTTSAARKKR